MLIDRVLPLPNTRPIRSRILSTHLLRGEPTPFQDDSGRRRVAIEAQWQGHGRRYRSTIDAACARAVSPQVPRDRRAGSSRYGESRGRSSEVRGFFWQRRAEINQSLANLYPCRPIYVYIVRAFSLSCWGMPRPAQIALHAATSLLQHASTTDCYRAISRRARIEPQQNASKCKYGCASSVLCSVVHAKRKTLTSR